MKIKGEAIQNYQCNGCVSGPYPKCYEESRSLGEISCENHCPGTWLSGVGKIFLGLPKGFNRLGHCDKTKIFMFKKFKDGWGYEIFNIPVWKYKDEFGNVIVRGLSPRINLPFIHIFLEDCLDEIDCELITNEMINEMY